jgi:hypothetical protein
MTRVLLRRYDASLHPWVDLYTLPGKPYFMYQFGPMTRAEAESLNYSHSIVLTNPSRLDDAAYVYDFRAVEGRYLCFIPLEKGKHIACTSDYWVHLEKEFNFVDIKCLSSFDPAKP